MSGWPGLAGSWPGAVVVEQGVWGKVHRQPSDFRWIAASSGLDLQGLAPTLGAGAEDKPTRCFFWRRLRDGRAIAVAAYPSRAHDAAGRSGFLERRVLLWRPAPGESIVHGLLALLAEAERLASGPSPAAEPGDWHRDDFHLPLDPLRVESPAAELESRAEEGRRQLDDSLEEETLAALYFRLLSGYRPAFVPSPRPFTAPELAALLLPFPRDDATFSLAGWLPSSRVSPSALAENWDLVVGSAARELALEPDCEGDPEIEVRAATMARAVVLGDPTPLALHVAEPSDEFDFDLESFDDVFEPPEPLLAPWLEALCAFVDDPEARWLDPAATAPGLPLDPSAAPRLADWRRELVRNVPEGADAWQWRVKVDLLAAVLVAVAPSSPEAGEVTFASGRVSPLHFVDRFTEEHRATWRAQCPAERLGAWREASRTLTRRHDVAAISLERR